MSDPVNPMPPRVLTLDEVEKYEHACGPLTLSWMDKCLIATIRDREAQRDACERQCHHLLGNEVRMAEAEIALAELQKRAGAVCDYFVGDDQEWERELDDAIVALRELLPGGGE